MAPSDRETEGGGEEEVELARMNDGRRSELISKAEIVSAPYFRMSVAFPPQSIASSALLDRGWRRETEGRRSPIATFNKVPNSHIYRRGSSSALKLMTRNMLTKYK